MAVGHSIGQGVVGPTVDRKHRLCITLDLIVQFESFQGPSDLIRSRGDMVQFSEHRTTASSVDFLYRSCVRHQVT